MKNRDLYKFTFEIIFSIALLILLAGTSFSIPTFSTNYGTNNSVFEDSLYIYNFSKNVTEIGGPDEPWAFSLYQINSTFFPSQQTPGFYSWISLNSSTGMLTINSTNESMCGRYNISVSVIGASTNGEQRSFFFFINASNDYPNITSINNSYNMTANVSFLSYVDGSDEERHYPLIFNISFYNNCTKYPWNNRANCSLFSFVNVSNTTGMMNYTSNKYDAGVYWANITVMDFGANYNCISGYCLANFSQNRTYYYDKVVQFNVYTYLEVNASNCSNAIFQENQSKVCYINITSREYGDNITYTSSATLRGYAGYVTNSSWFYVNGSNFTNNYSLSVLINITPQKSQIGNWTINFSAVDINFSEYNFDLFNITVNRTSNDIPRISSIPNVNTSTALLYRINITVYDDDNLIPDKNTYNETFRFVINVTNQTNSSQTFNFTNINFSVQIVNYSIEGTNRTEGKIEFTPNSTMAGSFYVNITVIDLNGGNASTVFNMSIKNNIAPQWNGSLNRIYINFEHNLTFLNLSMNVSDPNLDDSINFTYSIDSYFPSFDINITTGIINFTPTDSDVGLHIVTINASDGYLINSTTINFTILNVNETPAIRRPISVDSGGNGNSNSVINVYEDSAFIMTMYVEDSDLGIISNQKSYYNETLRIRNLTITGANTSLFNFTANPVTNNTNYTLFLTSSITPRRNDTGNYVIFINVSDNTNYSDSITFNLVVHEISHNPNITLLTNQTTAINRTLYYRINASDMEDGSSTTLGNNNFTFVYSFLNGTDFIKNNQSIFNSTTGILNYTFNTSEGGRYRLNITVNDTSSLSDSKTFWIYVYDVPNITSPSLTNQFLNLVENQSYLFNFTINHSVMDNLTCEFYIQAPNGTNLLKNNISVYGNNTIFYWNYSASYSDETFGIKNLTVIAYPSGNSLLNATSLNVTRKWNITINHSNAPLQFISNIGGSNQTISGGSPQQVILSDYFNDSDASDSHRNQTITFSYNTVSISGSITVSVTNWNGTIPVMSFSSSGAASASYTVTAIEWNETNSSQMISNVSSNSFTVELTSTSTTVVVTTPTSGGGGGSATVNVPYALKIIVPSKITGYAGEKMIIPLVLSNNGKETFKKVKLSAFAFKDKSLENMLKISFDNDTVDSLEPGKNISRTMTVYFKTNKTGDYEITVYANSTTPSYTDWSKIYINLQKINESYVKKFILFTEEFLVQNPSCLELTERLKEADKLVQDGDYSSARAVAEEVLNSCKKNIEQVSIPSKRDNKNIDVLRYFIIACIVSVFAGVLYYYIKRRKFSGNNEVTKNLFNKNYNL